MILADKIMELRKKEGWSQEQLAEKLGVSRQSVSKWESAQAMPDMNKLLQLSDLFAVSTDYLLREDMGEELKALPAVNETAVNEQGEKLTYVSLEEANEYLALNGRNAGWIAVGVAMCIVSPILLIFLAAAGEAGYLPITEDQGGILGLIPLILLIAGAVSMFVAVSLRSRRFEYLGKEQLDTAYGVKGMTKEARSSYESEHTRDMVAGIVLCIFAVVPALIGGFFEEGAGGKKNDFAIALGVCLLLAMVAAGVFLIVRTSVIWDGFQTLLEEGDYTRRHKLAQEKIGRIYWPVVTAVYLLVSFLTMRWDITWVIWPVAGVLSGIFG